MDWPTFCTELEARNDDVIQTALWGRDRIEQEDQQGVPGIGRLFVGHSIQWTGLRRFGNVYAVDTGAVFGKCGGRLTVINTELSTADAIVVVDVTNEIDARDGQIDPDAPFGS